jgi:integrase
MTDFQIHKKRSYKLSELKESFFIDLIIYLREEHNLFDNTLHRYVSVLKTFLRWCKKKGYSPPMDFLDIIIKTHETDDVALTKEEVVLIENAKLTGAKDRARDLFLIGIYSGQRFSDYSIFEKADIRDNLIHKTAKKTGAMSYIPLTAQLKVVLDKYDWILPKISNQKFNVHIQNICKNLGINEAVKKTVYYLEKVSVDVKGNMIDHVATISTNNDKELGKIIGDAFRSVGETGVVMMETSADGKTEFEVVEGVCD